MLSQWKDGGKGWRSDFPISGFVFLVIEDGLCSTTTIHCTLSLLRTVGSATICTGHSCQIAAPALWSNPVRALPGSPLLPHWLGLWWVPDCTLCSPLCSSFHPASTACFHMPTFRCFSAQISQMCLCVEHGILC